MNYLYIFLSSLLIYLAYYFFKKNNMRILSFIFKLGVVVELSYFAGVRDMTVGTDVTYYMVPSYKYAALYSTFNDYWSHYHFEFLYAFLSYFLQKSTQQNVMIFLGGLMLLVVGMVMLFINDNFDSINGFTAFCLFILGFYNMSLNYSRQMIAVSILIFSYKYLKRRKWVIYTFFVFIAFLFHVSALVGILFLIAFNFYKLRPKIRNTSNIIFIVSFFIFLSFYNKVILFFVEHGILESKYLVHLTSGINISAVNTVFHLFIIALSYVLIRNSEINNNQKIFYHEILIIDFAFLLIGVLSDTAYRLELYPFVYITLLIIPNCLKKLKIETISSILLNGGIVFSYVIYWYVTFVLQDIGQTFPYTSNILGWNN